MNTPTEPPEDLRKQVERVLLDKTRTNGTAQLATIANEIIRLCEAAVLAARIEGMEQAKSRVLRRTEIPKDAREPTRDAIVILGEQIADIIQQDIATAQANIHSVFGGTK